MPENFEEFFSALKGKITDGLIKDLQDEIEEEDWEWGDFKDIGWDNPDDNDFFTESERLQKRKDLDIKKVSSIIHTILTTENKKKENKKPIIKIMNLENIVNQWRKSKIENENLNQKRINLVCPGIWHDQDKALKQIIQLSIDLNKDNNDSLLMNLMDDFMRTRITYKDKNINVDKWGSERFKQMKMVDKSLSITLEATTQSMFSRGNNVLNPVSANSLIDLDIDKTCQKLISVLKFIKTLKTRKDLPLQFDFWFYPATANVSKKEDNNGFEDDDFDDDEDDDEKKDATSNKPFEEIGKKLKESPKNIIFIQKEYKNEKTINDALSEYCEKKKLENNNLKYHRFITIFDDTPANSKKNLTLFIPDKYGKHYENYIPESFLYFSRYIYKEANGAIMGCNQPANGCMFYLSFHILSESKVKAYFFSNGQMLRFFIEDVYHIFPLLMQRKNDKLQEVSKKIKEELDSLKDVLTDEQFDKFLGGRVKISNE